MTYGLEKSAANTVYHSVDLLHELPHVPAEAILASERELILAADLVAASSRIVEKHIHSLAEEVDVQYMPNVANIDLFTSRRTSMRTERAIFAGNLTPSKIDIDLMKGLADAGVQISIAGPYSIDGASDGNEYIGELLAHVNVEYLGNLDEASLATELGRSKVGLIPYSINPYTRGVFPMKVYEYLAAGLSVVTTPLPSLIGGDLQKLDLKVASTHGEFIRYVISEIRDFSNRKVEDLDLSGNSWESRITEIELILDALECLQPTSYTSRNQRASGL
ncbi:glycosyltransferase [Gordonia tangerina]|uniref:Glycosyltransferase n=1 Tax=Gordonia tangerina TaxID=2911060 RepID=A0ABS9DLT2_9ACTN|nr:glycosyltransferase [Gordonia tangerina]MCF3940193.1 glycosyltransferase [Gordonia tangerina]